MFSTDLGKLTYAAAIALLVAGCNRVTPENVTANSDGSLPANSPVDKPSVGNVTPDNEAESTSADARLSDQAGRTTPPPATAPPPVSPPAFATPVQTDQTQAVERPFMTLQESNTTNPGELVGYINEIDTAIQDLITAGTNNIVDKETYTEGGLRLGRMKLEAGRRLVAAADATDQQRKTGQMAQLVALSHMSGLRDVEAAKELERFARELADSDDADLAHQSRVVLMGFQLQAFQNGVSSDPALLVEQAKNLFVRPEDRNFPEFMMLQQARQILSQMGFAEAAKQMDEILVAEYRDSPDPQLRGEAWGLETYGSQALENFGAAMRSMGSESFDPQALLAAARGLFEAFPSIQTLEQLAGTITNIEYGGYVDLSQQLVEVIRQSLATLDAQEGAGEIEAILAGHLKRVSLIGKPLPLSGLIGFDGQPFNWSDYQGKALIVDFWATWCVPCLQEIPNIRETYADLAEKGFDVVSVNMDESLTPAEMFVQKRAFPWRTFHAEDKNALGFQSDFAKQLGISAIPFMILIGPDGNVAAIHVRGEKLAPAVRKLLNLETSLIP